MPLTLTLTEGVLPKGAESQAIEQLTKAMLERHDLKGNKVMTPNITAILQALPKGTTFSGGKAFAGAWVEWKVPSFEFANKEVQQSYFNDATDIIKKSNRAISMMLLTSFRIYLAAISLVTIFM